MERAWKPAVTVAAVIESGGRFLFVEEQTSDGLRLNQPAGHLEPGESLSEAVIREVYEETARHFVPQALVAIYQWEKPGTERAFVRFTFCGSVSDPEPGVELDEGIVRTLWLDEATLRACADRHRSPLVLRSVEDWRSGQRFALDLLAPRT